MISVVITSFAKTFPFVFTAFKDNPWVIKAFKGIRPVVIALIAVPMINMARKCCKSGWAWLLAFGALILVAFLNVSPIYIILCVIITAFGYTYIKEKWTR